MNDEAVTPALGLILLMPSLMFAAVVGVGMMYDLAEWSQAEGDRARFYAECARATTEGLEPDPNCPTGEWEDPPGYDCTRDAGGVMICKERDQDGGLLS